MSWHPSLAAVRMNHPEPAFTDEVTTLVQFMRSTSVRKGDHIYLTHVPGIGLHCSLAGKAEFQWVSTGIPLFRRLSTL